MHKNYFFLLLIVAVACGSPKKDKDLALLDSLENLEIPQPVVEDEKLNDIINQIPAPIELSAILKQSGARYNKSFLNDPENYSKYNSSFERALNLGVYGADLGYSNIYEENQQSILYVGAIKELVDDLRIDQFFNFHTIERLAEKRDLDSLLLLTTQNFNDVNNYFQEQQRSGLSVLMITGGWLEALHVANEVFMQNTENEDLMETIGEQKIVLERIMELLSYYKDSSEEFNELYTELKTLSGIFEKVQIETTYGEPTFEEVNGVLVAKDNSRTTVTINPGIVSEIQETGSKIRNNIII
jgi:hypothetical protein